MSSKQLRQFYCSFIKSSKFITRIQLTCSLKCNNLDETMRQQASFGNHGPFKKTPKPMQPLLKINICIHPRFPVKFQDPLNFSN